MKTEISAKKRIDSTCLRLNHANTSFEPCKLNENIRNSQDNYGKPKSPPSLLSETVFVKKKRKRLEVQFFIPNFASIRQDLFQNYNYL